jgi:hypothetical protein
MWKNTKIYVRVSGVPAEIRIVRLSNRNIVFCLYANRQKPALNCTGMSSAYTIVKNIVFHAPSDLPRRKHDPVPVVQESGWAPKLVWIIWREEIFLASAGN